MNRPGVLTVIAAYGRRVPVAECASCGQPRPIFGRGLCNPCRWRHREDGTISEYGYVKTDRVKDYARLRLGGCGIGESAGRVGVSKRTAERYEAALIAAGEAPWRGIRRAAVDAGQRREEAADAA